VANLDKAGEQNDSDSGNLIAVIRGNATYPRLLFVAHMDTVESGEQPIRPKVSDRGVVQSQGDTILGADNKSAVAALMRVCASVAALPQSERPTVVAAFTCREESGRMGASLLDLGDLEIDCGFCIDGNNPIGTSVIRTLGQRSFMFSIRGRSAHAAANPSDGLNAIRVASEIISILPLGRLPHGGSLNIASVVGGELVHRLNGQPAIGEGPEPDRARALIAASATNSIPDIAFVRGEVRAFTVSDMDETLTTVEKTIQKICETHAAKFDWVPSDSGGVPPFPGAAESPARELVKRAAARVRGVAYQEIVGSYTLELNYLAPWCDAVGLSSGGSNPHETTESISLAEFEMLEALLSKIVSCASTCTDRGRLLGRDSLTD
jgi:acetylornithine deacetylase/succinyl-diaminopimelate desuccinylase-like protein